MVAIHEHFSTFTTAKEDFWLLRSATVQDMDDMTTYQLSYPALRLPLGRSCDTCRPWNKYNKLQVYVYKGLKAVPVQACSKNCSSLAQRLQMMITAIYYNIEPVFICFLISRQWHNTQYSTQWYNTFWQSIVRSLNRYSVSTQLQSVRSTICTCSTITHFHVYNDMP